MNSTPPIAFLMTLLGLGRGVADELADQIVARHRHQVALAHVAELPEHFGHAQRDRGLAGARVAGEAHVQRGRLRLQALLGAQLVDQQQRRDVADAALDRRQPDQFGIELIEQRLHTRGLEHRAQGGGPGEWRIVHRGA
jgi:hypothetical protein